jgi:hypothetical protein
MFTRFVTKSRSVVVIAGATASIGLGAILAPTASALPVDHRCDRLVNAAHVYYRAVDIFLRRGDSDSWAYYYNEGALAQRDAEAAGCTV